MTILFPIIGLTLLTAFLAWTYEQERLQAIEDALPEEERERLEAERRAKIPPYDPDKDYFWRFDCWLGEKLEASDKWFADPVILICILVILVNL
jgi:hypothetical protein